MVYPLDSMHDVDCFCKGCSDRKDRSLCPPHMQLYLSGSLNLVPVGHCLACAVAKGDVLENEIAELRGLWETTLVILRRAEDVMYGGAVDHGIEDDISTLKNQIRKLLKTPDEEQVFEVEL